MKQISLIALCIINSFTATTAMRGAQKRRLPTLTEIDCQILNIFKCPRTHCQSSFETSDELEAHERAHEECDGKIFKCDTCGTSYFRKKDLTAHNNKKHGIKKETIVVDLPDEPFILKSPIPNQIDSMADTKKEMHILATTRSANAFECMAAAKPFTIVQMSYKPIADSYLCQICKTRFKQRVAYFNHLFDNHKYTYGPHSLTCTQKKAHSIK